MEKRLEKVITFGSSYMCARFKSNFRISDFSMPDILLKETTGRLVENELHKTNDQWSILALDRRDWKSWGELLVLSSKIMFMISLDKATKGESILRHYFS